MAPTINQQLLDLTLEPLEYCVVDMSEADHQCPECGQQFTSKTSFSKHTATCPAPKRKRSKRLIAKKIDETEAPQNDSDYESLQSDDQLFICDHCPFKTIKRSYLLRHVKRQHTLDDDTKWFYCNDCDYKSNLKFNLKMHLANRHGANDESNQLQCQDCDYRTPHQHSLNLHITKHHSSSCDVTVWLECKECNFKTKYESTLKRHQTMKHTMLSENGDRWFECRSCSFKTKRKYNLQRHQANMHSTNKKFYAKILDAKIVEKRLTRAGSGKTDSDGGDAEQ